MKRSPPVSASLPLGGKARSAKGAHHTSRCALAGVLVGGIALHSGAWAQELPLWEVGAGLGAISFPDYRGSDQQRSYVLPVPVVIYRGEVIQADRDRVRGLLWTSDRFEVDVSLNGSVPVRSHDNRAREGMPDLDPTLELGPSLNVQLARTSRYQLNLRLPVRAVIASDFHSVHGAGVLANPNVNLDVALHNGWQLGLVAGVLNGSRRYHEYFYRVAPEFARPSRPAFDVGGGYAGAQFVAAISKRYDRLFIGAFIKQDILDGAAFEASPLVKRHSNLSAGLAVTWVFAQSERRVEAER